MEAKVTWKDGMHLEGTAGSGFTLPMDTATEHGGINSGFRPMELLLAGLAGCTAMDVLSILKKKKQDVTAFEILVNADRASEHPQVFTHIVLHYVVTGRNISKEAVDRAIELSGTRYCPAQAMLGKVVPIEIKTTILDAG